MTVRPTRNPLRHPDYRALQYALIFLFCALVSSYGAGILALLFLLPGVAAVDLLLRPVQRHGSGNHHRQSPAANVVIGG